MVQGRFIYTQGGPGAGEVTQKVAGCIRIEGDLALNGDGTPLDTGEARGAGDIENAEGRGRSLSEQNHQALRWSWRMDVGPQQDLGDFEEMSDHGH